MHHETQLTSKGNLEVDLPPAKLAKPYDADAKTRIM